MSSQVLCNFAASKPKTNMKIWKNFKEKHPVCAKAMKLVTGIGGAGVVAYCGYKYVTHEPPMGNNSWRCHYRKDGKPKVKYANRERANIQVAVDLILHGTLMHSYKCVGCDGYHLGHKHKAA